MAHRLVARADPGKDDFEMGVNEELPPPTVSVLGTPLAVTYYEGLICFCQQSSRKDGPLALDFTNTQIVAMRRHEPGFARVTSQFDFFIPDGMPLIWCLNRQGAGLRDRVYGPTFMRRCVLASPAPWKHYFLGGSELCLQRLTAFFQAQNPHISIVGSHHGYYSPEEEPGIILQINSLSPDFVWVGLGTPKQQRWIHQHKKEIRRGILLAVGFAFDVNAGMKKDAPARMQRLGLTWVHRLASEPLRLGPRYLKYNILFIFYLLRAAMGRKR